jgi:hypothetical protein
VSNRTRHSDKRSQRLRRQPGSAVCDATTPHSREDIHWSHERNAHKGEILADVGNDGTHAGDDVADSDAAGEEGVGTGVAVSCDGKFVRRDGGCKQSNCMTIESNQKAKFSILHCKE